MRSPLTPRQKQVFKRFVEDRFVVDLGAHDTSLCNLAVRAGALSALACDKEPFDEREVLERGVSRRVVDFDDLWAEHSLLTMGKSMDVAIVSWPWTATRALLHLIGRANTVIYLGKNTDGVRCGSPKDSLQRELFVGLRRRQVLAYVPHQSQTLIVYDGPVVGGADRAPYEEEAAAIEDRMRPYTGTVLPLETPS